MKKPVKPSNRRRVWEELAQLDDPKNMTTYSWQRLKYTARKLAKFSLKDDENTAEAAKRLLRILWDFDGWHELKSLDTYYTDAIHLIKDIEDKINDSRKPLTILVDSISVKRLSDGYSFRGFNLKKEYYAARHIFDIAKRWQVTNLLNFLHENNYDFDQAKTDLRASEKMLKALMKKWKEHISSLKNPEIE